MSGNSGDPTIMVIFGSAGDLARRKLIPALYRLFSQRRLPELFNIVGVARRDWSHEEYRKRMRDALQEFGDSHLYNWEKFAACLHFQDADFDKPESYQRLKKLISEMDAQFNAESNRVYYLATPPEAFAPIVTYLADTGLIRKGIREGAYQRVVIEKPFGRDLESARTLNRHLHERLEENQIFRMDHFLGKETVQNILIFRFANTVFEPIWDRRYVDHVQITAAENIGIVDRGGYYDHAGALRDMFQNHLLQLLCLSAMEPPVSFQADDVHNEKVQLLRSIRPIRETEVSTIAVRGQYGGENRNGKTIKAYHEEDRVTPDSSTETFAAVKFYIDNWRWQGVPFYLRSGKQLSRKMTQIVVAFRQPPMLFFQVCPIDELASNLVIMRLQPDEGIAYRIEAKSPGQELCVRSVDLSFSYQQSFGQEPADAYETLIQDVIEGDTMLFTRSDWVEVAWEHIMPLLNAWESAPPERFPNYEPGSWGPASADTLIRQDNREWYS